MDDEEMLNADLALYIEKHEAVLPYVHSHTHLTSF